MQPETIKDFKGPVVNIQAVMKIIVRMPNWVGNLAAILVGTLGNEVLKAFIRCMGEFLKGCRSVEKNKITNIRLENLFEYEMNVDDLKR